MAAEEKQIRVPKMKLGSQGLRVSSLGLGCMGMFAFFGPPKPDPNMIELIHDAINSGVAVLHTADIYGPPTNEILIGKALKGGMREKVELATKCGLKNENGEFLIYGDPAYIRAAREASLKRLDVDYIDLYYLHRIDIRVPIEVANCSAQGGRTEETGGRMKDKVYRSTAGVVSVGKRRRGRNNSDLQIKSSKDFNCALRSLPRFQPENLEHHGSLFDRVKDMAARKGCTTSQLALAWIYHQGNDMCPIPGTINLNQNIGAVEVKLTWEEAAELGSIASSVKGDRYQIYDRYMATRRNSSLVILQT